MRVRTLLGAGVLSVMLAALASGAAWTPTDWEDEDTLELRTTGPEEGEHWFPVWLVVIDGQVYVRLGTRAADRIAHNTTAPYVGVRIAGQQFDRVKGEPAPEYVERVATAMGTKYWTDGLIRFFAHPLTLRLVPE